MSGLHGIIQLHAYSYRAMLKQLPCSVLIAVAATFWSISFRALISNHQQAGPGESIHFIIISSFFVATSDTSVLISLKIS